MNWNIRVLRETENEMINNFNPKSKNIIEDKIDDCH